MKLAKLPALALSFFVVAAIGCASSEVAPRSVSEPRMPRAVAALDLQTIDGRPLSLAERRGRPLVLIFWSPSRPGAAAQLRDVAALAELLAPDIDTVCVAVLAGTNAERRDVATMLDVPPRALEIGVLSHAHDAPDWSEAVSTPLFAVVDALGVVRARRSGAIDWRDRATVDEVRALAGEPSRRVALDTSHEGR